MIVTSTFWALAAGFAVGALFLCLLFLIVIGRTERIRRAAAEETATVILGALEKAALAQASEKDK